MTALFTIAQVQERLQCSRWKVYELARVGKLELRKLGGSTRITERSLNQLIDEMDVLEVKRGGEK